MNKIAALLYFLLLSAIGFCQTNDLAKIKIDTLIVNYKIKDIVEITSYVPQIAGNINTIAKNRINSDLKNYFQASQINVDSVQYVHNLLIDHDMHSLNEYFEMKKQQKLEDPNFRDDVISEDFTVEYLSENLLVVTVNTYIDPYHASRGFILFESLIYDLNNGSKLDFHDLFSIDQNSFIQKMRSRGYLYDADDLIYFDGSEYGMNLFLDFTDNIKKLFTEDADCINFYVVKNETEIEVRFKLKCSGPMLMDIGISITQLIPYMKHFEFKNKFSLWGKDIYALEGKAYPVKAKMIAFNDYSITNSGSGYLLPPDLDNPNTEYGITICHSTTSQFYLFLKYENAKNMHQTTVIDILEIKRSDMTARRKITEYCETKKGADAEIFALVIDNNDNPEFYTEIVKAWRANRKSEKFEPINKKKIRKCGNESYGL